MDNEKSDGEKNWNDFSKLKKSRSPEHERCDDCGHDEFNEEPEKIFNNQETWFLSHQRYVFCFVKYGVSLFVITDDRTTLIIEIYY